MMRICRWSLAMFLLCALAVPAAAQHDGASQQHQALTDADRQILRADSLYYRGDYYRAVSAYMDFLWDHPHDPRADRVRLKKAWVYYAAEEYRESARILDALAADTSGDIQGLWALHYLGGVAREADQFGLASRVQEELVEQCAQHLEESSAVSGDRAEHCQELMARSRLALADVHVANHDFDAAVEQLLMVPETSPFADSAYLLAHTRADLSIPTRSPALAGTLSIVPGLGHLYIGEYRNAALAMAWNGIFIYGLVDSIVAGRTGQAVLIGLLESIWYSGTIFGAVAGAQRFNRDARQLAEEEFRSEINGLAPDRPWPARFPVEAPMQLQLEFEF